MNPRKQLYEITDLVLRWVYLIIGAWLLAIYPTWVSLIATVIGGLAVLWASSLVDKRRLH